MQELRILKSEIDKSINYISPFENSYIEARYVSRCDDQTIVYVSSHNGCSRSCKMCHLTATGQTDMIDVTPELFGNQVATVLKDVAPTDRININFMSRGEALANSHIINNWNGVKTAIEAHTARFGTIKHNVSSIIPKTIVGRSAVEIFNNDSTVHLYWSLYSINQKFRKKWLAKAASPSEGIDFLKGFKNVVIHSAFIEGQNDSEPDVEDMLNFIRDNFDTMPKYNIVRYNPYSDKYGCESPRLMEIQDQIGSTANIIQRLDPAVFASCGTFIS